MSSAARGDLFGETTFRQNDFPWTYLQKTLMNPADYRCFDNNFCLFLLFLEEVFPNLRCGPVSFLRKQILMDYQWETLSIFINIASLTTQIHSSGR